MNYSYEDDGYTDLEEALDAASAAIDRYRRRIARDDTTPDIIVDTDRGRLAPEALEPSDGVHYVSVRQSYDGSVHELFFTSREAAEAFIGRLQAALACIPADADF